MKQYSIFRGISCAVVTPFKEDGSVDLDAFGVLIDRLLESPCASITVAGTTGEASTLTEGEHFSLIRFAKERIGGKVPLIAGTGSNCTEAAIRKTRLACRAGCDAVLVVSPYYNKATPRGLVESFSKIADASSVPMIIYNVPARTGVNIPLSVYSELAKHPNVFGIKDAAGDVAQTERTISALGDLLDVWCGNDDILLPSLAVGAVGGISVAANVIPNEMQRVCSLFESGNVREALALHSSLLPLIDALFCEVNPIPVKEALAMMGLISPVFRLPLCRAEAASRERIRTALLGVGVLEI